jgi:hypothetical protein
MLTHLWTRKVALTALVGGNGVAFALAVTDLLHKREATKTGIAIAAITGMNAVLGALGTPLSPRTEARNKVDAEVGRYRLLLDAPPARQNLSINIMRELAPQAQFDAGELSRMLDDQDPGVRMSALATVQWQWQDTVVDSQMNFQRLKGDHERPPPLPKPEDGYILALVRRTCDSSSDFENYHATQALWSMLALLDSTRLSQHKDATQILCRLVKSGIHHQCREWPKFEAFVSERFPPL